MLKRISKWMLRHEIGEMEQVVDALKDAYLDGPWIMPPSQLASRINSLPGSQSPLMREALTSLQVDLMSQLGYSPMGASLEYEREIAIQSSRRLWRLDTLTQWAIWLWTYYGFGQQISVSIEDEAQNTIFSEFWNADRNYVTLGSLSLPQLSHQLLVDGEVGLLYFTSTLDGETTVRRVFSADIQEVIMDPDDACTPIFYRLNMGPDKKEVYVPDLRHRMMLQADGKLPILPEEKRAVQLGDDLRPQTIVSLQLIAFNQKDFASTRGWPLITAGAPWARTYKTFMEDRATLAAAIAQYAYKAKVKGGSRAVDAMRSRLDELMNPQGTGSSAYAPQKGAGRAFVENDAVDLQKLTFGTGASDAKADGEALLNIASLGVGLFPHYAGAGDAYRLATATSMETPLRRQWTAYQNFWAAQFRQMARYVVWASETKGNAAAASVTILQSEITISTDHLLDLDTQELATAVSTLIRDTIIPLVGIIPPETIQRLVASVWKMMLSAFNVSNVDGLTSDAAFGIGELEAMSEAYAPGVSHQAEVVHRPCPFPDCDGQEAYLYPGHKGLLVCATCARTFDPSVE